jgi:hypothetical protein
MDGVTTIDQSSAVIRWNVQLLMDLQGELERQQWVAAADTLASLKADIDQLSALVTVKLGA